MPNGEIDFPILILIASPREEPMKINYAVAAFVMVTAASFLMGRMTAEKTVAIHQETTDNLSNAMHGEAFAFAKYMLYAEHARENGHPELADLFSNNAHTERFEHFAEEAKLFGLVKSDEENLRDAIQGETYEFEHMYPDFARKAKVVGDTAAANRFLEIRKDEGNHRDAFQSALDKLQKNAQGSGN